MDRVQIEHLYRDFGPSVYRRARSILQNEEDAREVMQEVFISAMRKGHTFEGVSSVMTWLYAITTNRCLNRLKRSKQRANVLSSFDPKSWTSELPHPEVLSTLRGALQLVPRPLAEVAVYYYIDELTHQEIAELIGCSRRKVGYLLQEFRERVQEEANRAP